MQTILFLCLTSSIQNFGFEKYIHVVSYSMSLMLFLYFPHNLFIYSTVHGHGFFPVGSTINKAATNILYMSYLWAKTLNFVGFTPESRDSGS